MAQIFRSNEMEFDLNSSPIPDFSWHSSPKLSKLVDSKHLHFDIRRLDSNKYSYPYHFHRNAEELFVIMRGKVMLRTPDGFFELEEGDVVFFEMGSTGAHQLFNHTTETCQYLDIRTEAGIDICEYPDSEKISIIPYHGIYEMKDNVDYFKGEDNVKKKWPRGSL